jgi:tetratricopeptide (TPR) repeat protein
MGGIGLITFQFFAIAFDVMGRHVLAKIFRYGSLLMPVLGILLNDAIGVFVDRVFGSIYLPKGGKTARAHSEGEAMFQRQQYGEAVDWFVAAVMADPTDWEAQLRVVEILAERFDDPERLGEERNRLLKIKEVPEGLWIQTAFDLGEDWERLDRPDRAINIYKGLLWRLPEGPDADEVRRRLKNLGTTY